jgi:hypothetical protein
MDQMMTKLAPIVLLHAALLVGVSAREARADEVSALIIDATVIQPLGEKGRVSESDGLGAELRLMPEHESVTVSIGGYGAIGQPNGDKTMRDIYDFHTNVGFKPEHREGAHLIPYASIGLDILYMATHEPTGEGGADLRTLRGTTLGVSAQLGMLGYITERFVYRVSASYLGAVVPGTGDDLGGLVLQVGIGKIMGD